MNFTMEAINRKLGKILRVGLIVLLWFAAAFSADAIPLDKVCGPMCIVRDTVTGLTLPMSPENSQYNVVITDGMAHIRLTQLFVNHFKNVNDIVYVFPLPHEGSVHAMSMEYNDSLYVAEIYEKNEAEKIYEEVKASGGNAALLVQEKPNIFQQRLANIALGDSAYIRIELSMPLKYNSGEYELAIPTMVAERFGDYAGLATASPGIDPWNPPANREGHTLQINTLLQTGYSIEGILSPTHPLSISQFSEARGELVKRGLIWDDSEISLLFCRGILLEPVNAYPNKDFVLRFKRSSSIRDFSLASYFDKDKNQGYMYLNLFPDTALFAGDRPDLEILLLIDISGSQSGWPLDKEKEIALDILSRLKSGDRFTLMSFESNVQWAFGSSGSVVASADNISKAKDFVNGLSSRGGTNLLDAVNTILSVPQVTEHQRYFIFMTDGFITNESAILEAITNDPSNPTIFTFGAGNNLNRYFLEQAAAVGNGFSTPVTQYESVEPLVSKAWEKIESPQLKNVSVDFGGSETSDILMPNGTRLYTGSPITLFGKYALGGQQTVTVRGYRNGELVEFTREFKLAEAGNMNTMIPQIWAKQKIEQLRLEEGTGTSNKDTIIAISKEYQVLCKYTAFLAVNPKAVEEGASIEQDYKNAMSLTPVFEPALMQAFTLKLQDGYLWFTFPQNTKVFAINIYGVDGRLLYSLNNFQVSNGGLVKWDGRMANGKSLRAGQYYVRIHTNTGVIARKFIWTEG